MVVFGSSYLTLLQFLACHIIIVIVCTLLEYSLVVLTWYHAHFGGALMVCGSLHTSSLWIAHLIMFQESLISSHESQYILCIDLCLCVTYEHVFDHQLLKCKSWNPMVSTGFVVTYVYMCNARTSASSISMISCTIWRCNGNAHKLFVVSHKGIQELYVYFLLNFNSTMFSEGSVNITTRCNVSA